MKPLRTRGVSRREAFVRTRRSASACVFVLTPKLFGRQEELAVASELQLRTNVNDSCRFLLLLLFLFFFFSPVSIKSVRHQPEPHWSTSTASTGRQLSGPSMGLVPCSRAPSPTSRTPPPMVCLAWGSNQKPPKCSETNLDVKSGLVLFSVSKSTVC